MKRVMTTPTAVLLELDALRIVLLVFLGRVIAALALGAGQSDQRAHVNPPKAASRPGGDKPPGIAAN
jgi:hypothetical protein